MNVLASVRPAVAAALATGLAVVALRLVRRETPQQAVSGLFGLVLAAVLAVRFRGGNGSGFFLPTVVFSAAYTLGFLVSVLVRKPLVGVIAAAVQGHGPQWRHDPIRYRAAVVATLAWALLFAAKAGVQGWLLLTGASVTSLGVVKLAMGYPLTIAAVGLTLVHLRAAQRRSAAR